MSSMEWGVNLRLPRIGIVMEFEVSDIEEQGTDWNWRKGIGSVWRFMLFPLCWSRQDWQISSLPSLREPTFVSSEEITVSPGISSFSKIFIFLFHTSTDVTLGVIVGIVMTVVCRVNFYSCISWTKIILDVLLKIQKRKNLVIKSSRRSFSKIFLFLGGHHLYCLVTLLMFSVNVLVAFHFSFNDDLDFKSDN